MQLLDLQQARNPPLDGAARTAAPGTPESDLATYTFSAHKIQHRFCASCGVATFSEGADRTGAAIAAVNVRCLDGIEPANLPITKFDGRSL